MEKLYHLLKILSGCMLGVFIGTSIFQIWDYKVHPGIYELNSAPWYLSIQISALALVIVEAVLFLLMWMLKKRIGGKRR